MGSLRTGVLALALSFVSTAAFADDDLFGDDETPKLVDLTAVATLAPDTGLVDLVVADDDAGILAYVVADAADRAEVHVFDVGAAQEVRMFDISAFTSQPERMWLVGKGAGASVFVTARDDDDHAIGALYDAKGKKLRGWGPADSLAVIKSAKGKPQILVHKVVPGKTGETHQLELFEPTKKGKKIGKPKKLALVGGYNEKLGFRVNHWMNDYTVAIGIKDGEWSKEDDTRQADVVGRYDLLTGKMTTTPKGDLKAHAKRFEALASATSRPAVVVQVGRDLTGLEVWRDDQLSEITLDQAFELYDPKSLAYGVDDDGSVWLGLRVDPWNRPALKRKRADLEYFDLFHLDASGQATRKGRVLAPKGQFAIGGIAGRVWLIERNVGFDRGGSSLVLYQ